MVAAAPELATFTLKRHDLVRLTTADQTAELSVQKFWTRLITYGLYALHEYCQGPARLLTCLPAPFSSTREPIPPNYKRISFHALHVRDVLTRFKPRCPVVSDTHTGFGSRSPFD